MLIQEDYFRNIFNTVREGILILDENMRVLSANRSFLNIFKVDTANTINHLLYDLGNGQWNIPGLRVLLEDILPKNDTVDDYKIEHNFESIGQKTMLLNARKIVEKNNAPPIILLAIEDITERREIEKGLEKSRKELVIIKKAADEAGEFSESVINTVREPLISLDQDLRVVTVSRSFCDFFKVKPEETVGQLIYDLGNKQWDIPKLRDLLETILPQKTTFDDFEVEHDFATIGRRIMLLNARQIQRASGQERIILLAIEDITERKRLEDLLRESEKRYRRVYETASDGIVLLEKNEGQIVHANPSAEKMLGYTEEEYIGKKLQDIGVSLDMNDFPSIMQSLEKCGILKYDDVPVKTSSGQDIYTDIYMVDRAKLAQCNIRDVTKRKQKEENIRGLDRTLLARSKSSKAMMSATDEAWYLNEVCRIIVEDCGHALVWIGFAVQDEGRTVRPVASAGFEEGYLDALNITWSDADRGRGPAGTAIRTGKPSIVRDILGTPAFAPWRDEAVRRGYAAIISVPLLAEGSAFGSLNIYSRHEDPFSEEEVQLLTDLAADLSYGIAAIRLRTAQAQAVSALRESEMRYHSLFDNMIEGFAYCKLVLENGQALDFIYLTVNYAFETLTGLRDVVGKKISEVMPGIREANPELLEVYGRVALTGKPERFETFSNKFGGWLSISVYSTEREHFAAVFENITERKRTERALTEKEARLRILVETIPDLIWLKDADGIYLFCNKMFELLYGAKESDIIGKTDYDFVGRELADFFRDHDRKAAAAGKPSSNMEWLTFASDGRRALVNTIKTPMYDSEGKLLGVLGIGRDITEYQKLEDQLRHAQKLEGIGTLAGGIAHDFNNILSAIIGYGHVTLMKMPKDDPLRLNIEHMLESADRAAALTQSLLAFSRKQITNRKPVELNSVLRKVEKFLVRIIGEDVAVRLLLAERALTIFADAGQLEQVFMNLATNARDAMPNGGSFTIETSIRELDSGFAAAHGYGKEGVYAMISATDTGVGMTEETRNKIFEPFFTTKEFGKGTGLGLAMVYGILKQHEGFINVYSEPGKGTTVWIYLPLITASALDELKTIAAEYPKGGTETILVAEDDASLRNLNVLVLEQMGYTVITANDGEEAVTKFRENKDRIQLLLFDIVMPKKNGREAYEEISRVMPNVPVLFASGYSPDMLRQKALIEKGAAIVYKPISPMDLSKKVRELLDK